MFDAPIPGQSLTTEPKNYPWENPPQFDRAEQALMWHMERLEEPKRIESFLYFLEMDVDVVTLTEGILRNAVADGRHSIDISLLIAPVIHQYIVGVAELADINFKEGTEEEDTDPKQLEYIRREKEAIEILKDIKQGEEPDLTDLESATPKPSKPAPMPEEKPKGLMARPQGVN